MRRSHAIRLLAAMLIPFCAAAAGKNGAAAGRLATLYAFARNDGSIPVAGVQFDTAGALYGATRGGGIGSGTIFRLTPPAQPGGGWVAASLHRFRGGRDGAVPVAAPIFAFGVLYGATAAGGRGPCSDGCGTVYALSPPPSGAGAWTETVLHRFAGGGDGAVPSSGLVADSFGALYGETLAGGAYDQGTVFRLEPASREERVLFSFRAAFGAFPLGGLVSDSDGALYGVASRGGRYGSGMVFALVPPAAPGGAWSAVDLHDFAGGKDGAEPGGPLVFDSRGVLYGTTQKGGGDEAGTVFALTPPAAPGRNWTESVLHRFTGDDDGRVPNAGLLLDMTGTLYGSTAAGGAFGGGTLFALAPAASGGDRQLTVLHRFTRGPDGARPMAGLGTDGSGALYGVTERGGTARGGTAFRLIP